MFGATINPKPSKNVKFGFRRGGVGNVEGGKGKFRVTVSALASGSQKLRSVSH